LSSGSLLSGTAIAFLVSSGSTLAPTRSSTPDARTKAGYTP
jgi:hypothetical protein